MARYVCCTQMKDYCLEGDIVYARGISEEQMNSVVSCGKVYLDNTGERLESKLFIWVMRVENGLGLLRAFTLTNRE